MTGLLLLFVTGLWMAIVIWLSKIIMKILPETKWRSLFGLLVFVALLPLPVIDEIVGGWQFQQLCKENSTIQVDREKAKGRTVYFAHQPDIEIKGSWVRIILQPALFADATTGKPVISFNDLIAEGGWFIRTLGISEGGMPLTFKGSCHAESKLPSKSILKELDITLIRGSEIKTEKKNDNDK